MVWGQWFGVEGLVFGVEGLGLKNFARARYRSVHACS